MAMPPNLTQGRPAQPTKKPPTIKDYLESKKQALSEAAGKYLDPDKLVKVALNCLMKQPDLGSCTQLSLLQSLVQCAEWGVYPGTGVLAQAYMISYNNKVKSKDAQGKESIRWEKQCQAQLSYQGMMTQVRRAMRGDLLKIESHVVYEGEVFRVSIGSHESFIHEPDYLSQEVREPIAVYAQATLKNNIKHQAVLPWQQVMKIRNASKSKDSGPWKDWTEEMAKKTAVRQLVKYLPSVELEEAVGKDDEANVIDGTVTGSAALTPGISAPPPSYLKPLRRELPESTAIQSVVESSPEPEMVDQETGEVYEAETTEAEADEALERMRQADAAARAEAAALTAGVTGGAPAPQQGQPGIDFSAPDATDRLIERMQEVEADANGTTEQLQKLAKLSERCPAERRAEIGPIYTKLRASIVARRKG